LSEKALLLNFALDLDLDLDLDLVRYATASAVLGCFCVFESLRLNTQKRQKMALFFLLILCD
jgi:hypothetical protein